MNHLAILALLPAVSLWLFCGAVCVVQYRKHKDILDVDAVALSLFFVPALYAILYSTFWGLTHL